MDYGTPSKKHDDLIDEYYASQERKNLELVECGCLLLKLSIIIGGIVLITIKINELYKGLQ